MNALQTIQQKLKSPKSEYNNFGKYAYRNFSQILENVKPLLVETDSILSISDDIFESGGFVFVKATATLKCKDEAWVSTAFARHADKQAGMQEAQITGAASSYARKYALNGLFLIDDSRDADTTNKHGKDQPHKNIVDEPVKAGSQSSSPVPAPKSDKKELPWLNINTPEYKEILTKKTPLEEVKKSYRVSKATEATLKSLI